MGAANNMTPEQAFQQLQDWYVKKQKLSELKQEEHLQRVSLAGFYFPSPQEGTNRLDLGGGYDLKLVAGYNITVDEAAVEQVTQAQIKKHKLPWDELFVYKPALDKKVFNSLTSEQQKFVQTLLEYKPASPQLDIVPSADREGQVTHALANVKAPPTVSQAAPNVVVTLDTDTCEVGQFYFDGENLWQLREDGEWDQITEGMPLYEEAMAQVNTPAPKPSKPRGRRKAGAK